MARIIRFNNCFDCPFGRSGIGIKRNDAMCKMNKDGSLSKFSYRLIWDGNSPPKNHCPFPKGIIISSCKGCPYVEENWGEYSCPKIEKRMLLKIKNPDKFHRYCPLESADCDRKIKRNNLP